MTDRAMAAAMPEAELQRLVAEMCGWLRLFHYHSRTSIGSAPGWPDSVIVGTRVIYRELKSEHGRLTPEQRALGYRLQAAGASWAVWRPSDWLAGRVERELRLLCPQPVLPL